MIVPDYNIEGINSEGESLLLSSSITNYIELLNMYKISIDDSISNQNLATYRAVKLSEFRFIITYVKDDTIKNVGSGATLASAQVIAMAHFCKTNNINMIS